jgi:hypothetical protein
VSRLAAASLALLLLGACGGRALPMRPSSRAFTQGDYQRIYADWTREHDDFSFNRLEDVLHVTATFESWEFRWAYVVRYAADHSFTTEERTRLLEESLADARQRHRFFVTLGGANWREGDLTGRQSDWRVLLVDPTGRQIEPVELTRIGRPSADQRTYFPSIQRQRHTFMIAFPTTHPDGTPAIPPDADHVVLRFAGSAGTVELRWEIEQSVPAGAPLDGN